MKNLLYITNAIHGSGGLERVLAVKTNYLINQYGYTISIVTLNSENIQPFYNFNNQINFYNINVSKNLFAYGLQYYKGIKKIIAMVNPHGISVCDDGLKGLLFPMLFGKKIPVIYERHVSKLIEFKAENTPFYNRLFVKIKFKIMDYLGGQFHKFILLTKGNCKEWNLKNIKVIPNPLPFNPIEKSTLKNKKVLAVGKQSYQKGYDRLLKIWKIAAEQFPDWQLEVYGTKNQLLGLEQMAVTLGLQKSVSFLDPIASIEAKYKEASIYVMSSRYEGFGMVLIEAMSFGIPCISFSCPHGPSDIIINDKNGFLIPDGDTHAFAAKLTELMGNYEKRKSMGAYSKNLVTAYNPKLVSEQWHKLFQSLK